MIGRDQASLGVPGETLRIAKTERVDGRASERVVGRHGSVGVHTDDLPGERARLLSELALAVVAHAAGSLAVGSELDPAPVVSLDGAGEVEDDRLVPGDAVSKREPADAVELPAAGPGCRVTHVQEPVVVEAWIKRQAQEAGFHARHHLQHGDRFPLQTTTDHYPDPARALGDEEPTV